MPNIPTDDWQDIAQTVTVRRLVALAAYCDYAKLAGEGAAVRRVVELLTGSESGPSDPHPALGSLPALASRKSR